MSLFKGIRYYLLKDQQKKKALKSILGFQPSSVQLYEQAFRHKSVLENRNKEIDSNERLEFLGDAILGAIIANFFYKKFPYKDEGFLTKMRSKMVSRKFLNQLAIDIGLDVFLETSLDLSKTKSIYGDAFEALLGAIYLDKGYKTAERFMINRVIREYINVDQLIDSESDYKSKVMEWAQKAKKNIHFSNKSSENENGAYFIAQLILGEKAMSKAESKSKKEAEQLAAKKFWEDRIAKATPNP